MLTYGPAQGPAEAGSVIIVGGGPCGLMLANELGRRGITATLVDAKSDTAFNPQANATQARTMEHYRRHGFADEVRALGLPPDFPTDIAYFTRYACFELARFSLPSARDAKTIVRTLSGSWSAAELPHRVSQKFVEKVLRRHAERLPGISVNYGWRMTDFRDLGDRVEVEVEKSDGTERRTLKAAYLMAADGPRSLARNRFGFRWTGETGVVRDFFGGRMYAIYVNAPEFYRLVPHKPAWMNVTFNRERRAFMASVDGKGQFAFHTQLRAHEDGSRVTSDVAAAMFRQGVGAEIPVEVLACETWTAGHALVAEHFRQGRVFLGGDAVHLFTPAGGLGYNTAIEDAVNLGWKLAAVLKGRADAALLDSYEAERKPLAIRNTGYARGFAESLGNYQPVAEIEDAGPAGETARRIAGEYLEAHGRAEFNIPGITFGGRYDGSPAIVSDGTSPPEDAANRYEPSACPGGRPPHLWLPDGSSLYDRFGFEFTLLRLGPRPPEAAAFVREAERRGIELVVADAPSAEARDLYGADLALIRPDQIVGWRGNDPLEAPTALGRTTGRP